MKQRPDWATTLASSLENPGILVEPQVMVDGIEPAAMAIPETVDEVSLILAHAQEHGLSVVPMGGGTALHLGNRPRGVDLLLSLRGLRDGFDHSASDLVATLPAGITVGEANARLESNGQYLPLDPPMVDDATVGGALAANSIGPRVQCNGMPRGWVLGMTVVHSDGSVTKPGGKVVKNVTGYDLGRVYVGSLGTLGIIVDATLKIQPLPQTVTTLGFALPNMDGVMRTAEGILEAGLNPLAISALNMQAVAGLGLELTPSCLLVEFGGGEAAVSRRVSEARKIAGKRGADRGVSLRGKRGRDAWRRVADLPGEWDIVFRASLPPASVGPYVDALAEALARVGVGGSVLAYVGRGMVYAGTEATTTRETLVGLFEELVGLGTSMGGHTILWKALPDLKEGLDVWGPKPDSFDIMRRLKHEFDRSGTLNPGRFVGGL